MPSRPKDTTVLSVRVEGHGQTVDYIEHVDINHGLDTLRICIHDDSHADQAWARVDRWSGVEWLEVVSQRGDALKIEHGIGYRKLDSLQLAAAFEADRNNLFKLALEVVHD